jgi:hypothetical protein
VKLADDQFIDLDATNSSSTNRKPTDCHGANSQSTDSDCANGQRPYGFSPNTLGPKPDITRVARRFEARKNLRSIVDQTTFTPWHSSSPKHSGDVDPKRPNAAGRGGALSYVLWHFVPHRPLQLLIGPHRRRVST